MHNTNKSTKKEVDNYRKIYELFTIKDLLTTKNPLKKELGITQVTYDKTSNSKGAKSEQYKIEDSFGKQRLLLYDGQKKSATENGIIEKTKEKAFYKNYDRAEDKGDLFQFLKNRTPNKKAKEVFLLLEKHDFYNKAEQWKEHIDVEYAYRKHSPTTSKAFNIDDFSNLRSIEKLEEKEHFLSTRKIKNETLKDPIFKGKVLVYDHIDKFGKEHQNIMFPKMENGNIRGAEVKPPYGKGYCFGKDQLLWCSNKPEQVDKIFLVESALNALSHKQLYSEENKNTWYFSTNGNLYPTRMDQLFKEIETHNIDLYSIPLVLGTDNDFDGVKYDVTLLNRFLDKKNSFVIDDSFNTHRAISFSTYDPEKRSEVHALFIELNKSIENSQIHADDKKIYFTYSDKNTIAQRPLLAKNIKETLSFTQDLPISFDKASKWNDWNDVVQYDFNLKDFDNLQSIGDIIEEEETNILNRKGISNDVLQDPSFINKIFIYEDKNEFKDVKKAVFYPKYKEGYIVGAEIEKGNSFKNLGFKKQLWQSNKPHNVDKIVVVEKPLFALSHKQLDPLSNQNTWYFSTGNKSSQGVIEQLFNEIKAANIAPENTLIEVGTQNNIWSINLELALINKFQNLGSFRVVYDENPDTISFKPKENANHIEVTKFFEKIKSSLNNTYMKSGENSFIKIIEKEKETLLKFPSSNKLKRVSHAFSHCLQNNISVLKGQKLRINKAKSGEGKNLNERLLNKLGIKQQNSPNLQKKKYHHKIKV